MIKALLQFAALCRAGGLRISTAEILDVVECLEVLEFADENSFRAALRANFVKEEKDRERFEKIYDLYFHTLRIGADDRQARSLSRRLIDLVEAFGPEEEAPSSLQAFLDFLSGDAAAFLKELQKILDLELDAPEVPFSDILPPTRRQAAGRDLRKLLQEAGIEEADPEGRRLGNLLTERLMLAGQMQANGPPGQGLPTQDAGRDPCQVRNLGELPFSHLSRQEAREVHEAIERLARKLRDIVARRYHSKREGVVDIKKTIRRSVRYQGIPLEIRFRRRQKRKPKIVALCDVSYSVWQAVPFMLNILYSVQDCLTRVRSFVFIAQVTDVSDTMKNYDILEAIDRVMSDFKLELPRNAVYGDEKDRDAADADPEISDYGAAFTQFNRDFLDVLDKKTTLIILGDGRTNFLAARAELLEEMRDRCRRVVWLNPEAENLWGDGDSAMEIYRPFCDDLRPCRNLNELSNFISSLVL
jgi:uncharacterized protein with von Willebrand factor type A (vWA) domain